MDFSTTNENDWDAFMGYDPNYDASAAGFEMQGVGLGEADSAETHFSHNDEGPILSQSRTLLHDSGRYQIGSAATNWSSDGHLTSLTKAGIESTIIEDNEALPFLTTTTGPGGAVLTGTASDLALPAIDLHSSRTSVTGERRLGQSTANTPTSPTLVTHNASSQDLRVASRCLCLNCLELSSFGSYQDEDLTCRLPRCHVRAENFSPGPMRAHREHERNHFGQTGSYVCAETGCHTVTKKWSDLKRHYASQHCTNTERPKHACPAIGCKCSGSNGFARKDKLKSHFQNMHEGKAMLPGKSQRVIKPKLGGTA